MDARTHGRTHARTDARTKVRTDARTHGHKDARAEARTDARTHGHKDARTPDARTHRRTLERFHAGRWSFAHSYQLVNRPMHEKSHNFDDLFVCEAQQ